MLTEETAPGKRKHKASAYVAYDNNNYNNYLYSTFQNISKVLYVIKIKWSTCYCEKESIQLCENTMEDETWIKFTKIRNKRDHCKRKYLVSTQTRCCTFGLFWFVSPSWIFLVEFPHRTLSLNYYHPCIHIATVHSKWDRCSDTCGSSLLSPVIRAPSSLLLQEVQHVCEERHRVLHPVRQRQLDRLHQRGHCLCELQTLPPLFDYRHSWVPCQYETRSVRRALWHFSASFLLCM